MRDCRWFAEQLRNAGYGDAMGLRRGAAAAIEELLAQQQRLYEMLKACSDGRLVRVDENLWKEVPAADTAKEKT